MMKPALIGYRWEDHCSLYLSNIDAAKVIECLMARATFDALDNDLVVISMAIERVVYDAIYK